MDGACSSTGGFVSLATDSKLVLLQPEPESVSQDPSSPAPAPGQGVVIQHPPRAHTHSSLPQSNPQAQDMPWGKGAGKRHCFKQLCNPALASKRGEKEKVNRHFVFLICCFANGRGEESTGNKYPSCFPNSVYHFHCSLAPNPSALEPQHYNSSKKYGPYSRIPLGWNPGIFHCPTVRS